MLKLPKYTYAADARSKVKFKNIDYLVLEGGGGAGNAFFGALLALEQVYGVLQTNEQTLLQEGIAGFAGSSAGAITALLLSMGQTPMEIGQMALASKASGNRYYVDFDSFFDEIKPGRSFRPRAFGYEPQSKGWYDRLAKKIDGLELSTIIVGLVVAASPLGGVIAVNAAEAAAVVLYVRNLLLTSNMIASNPILKQKLADAFDDGRLLNAILADGGVFTGKTARDTFAGWIERRALEVIEAHERQGEQRGFLKSAPAISRCGQWEHDRQQHDQRSLEIEKIGTELYDQFGSVRYGEMSFDQHHRLFGCSLVVTGSNFASKKSEYFSHWTTPGFSVADAVRVSMSLPVFFKPMQLYTRQDYENASIAKDPWLRGTWVDGGYMNNCPIDAFDQRVGGFGRTLGLRLRGDERSDVEDGTDLLTNYAKIGGFGAGESHISRTTAVLNRCIELEVSESDMGLIDFRTKSADIFRQVNERTYGNVIDYFNEQFPFGKLRANYRDLYRKFEQKLYGRIG
jgi:NTE family protein